MTSGYAAHAANTPGTLYFPLTYPLYGTLDGRTVNNADPNLTHDGYDMHAYQGEGAPVYASYSGQVAFAGAQGRQDCGPRDQTIGRGYGTVVYVDHGNALETRYAHLQNTQVTAGQFVSTGQLIGYEGKTGASNCGAHLHFEIKNTSTGQWFNVNDQMASIPIGGPITAQSPIGFSGAWELHTDISGGTTKVVYFGLAGDIPLSGDWNGDLFDSPGVVRYNPSTDHLDWYLNNTNLSTVASGTSLPTSVVEATYGDRGDTPVAGNWDASGGDNKGVVRRSGNSEFWYLQLAPAWGFSYAVASDIPVTGDWDCDSRDSPGISRATGGGSLQWHLDNQFGSAADYVFLFGASYPSNVFDRAMSGRWSAGIPHCSRPVLGRDGAKEWYLSGDFAGTLSSQATWAVSANDVPMVLDWDSDNRDDFAALS